MEAKEKRTLKYIGKVSEFNDVVRKLTTNQNLSDQEKSYLLSASILLIKHYQNDKRFTSYIDFAYYLIPKIFIEIMETLSLYMIFQ